MRAAIVHDWLVNPGGAENVLKRIIAAFPEADLFAVCDFLSEENRHITHNKKVKTTFIQNLPGSRTNYRSYLPLMPLAIEQIDLSNYDLIISSSHAVAKGVIIAPDQLHVCVCYSPIRYAWDMMHQYLQESGMDRGVKSAVIRYILHRLRSWDSRSANSVDHFIAISNYIAARIEKCYRRKSTVIYPPVDTRRFTLADDKSDFYLTASRLVSYKRVDVIVRAFNQMPNKRLVVIGDGPEMKKIQTLARDNVQIIGYQSDDVLIRMMQQARGFMFAACEDFGIVPLEAQACGTPVLAYGRGGALETIVDGVTGIFFSEQSEESIIETVERFEKIETKFNPSLIREHALNFSTERFDREFHSFMNSLLTQRTRNTAWAKKLSMRRRFEPSREPVSKAKRELFESTVRDERQQEAYAS